MAHPATLTRDISPPPSTRKASSCAQSKPARSNRSGTQKETISDNVDTTADIAPTLAAIEAGQAQIRDHLAYFSKALADVSRPTPQPRLSIAGFETLYKRNQHKRGRHFVVHQHDHPISGVHYDLRLQFSDSSTISFAVPYGLPGNPNSIRSGRMAIETRVHNLWNNLIESASHATGSLLIWDTGEYEIIPRKGKLVPTTDDELTDGDNPKSVDRRSHTERLISAFQGHHIRLRLNGTRLPTGYTVSLRLPTMNDRSKQPNPPGRKRRRVDTSKMTSMRNAAAVDSDTECEAARIDQPQDGDVPDNDAAGIASEDDEDAAIRANNAYTGASNTIGSVHQRHWLLTLDRKRSGFHKAGSGPDEGRWVGAWEPFFVLGRDHERSVVTGRNADEVMEDEEVEQFVGRKMWRPILE